MKILKTLAAAAIAVLLTACGGGGGGSSSAPGTTSDLTVSGTAATGMAIAGATINAKCQAGTGTATTIADGTFTLVVTGGKLPCVLQITNPLDGTKLHTVATGSGSSAVANITPLTEMLTARILGNEPVVFFAAFDAATLTSTVTTAAVKAAQTDVGTILTGTVDTSSLSDFVATPLKAATQDNMTGGDAQDKMLDALRVKLNGAQLAQVVTALAHTTNTADIAQVVATIVAAPTAAISALATSYLGVKVHLDGSGSLDSADSNLTLTYSWALTSAPSGSSAAIDNPTSQQTFFIADKLGDYVVSLVVTTAGRSSATATKTIPVIYTYLADTGQTLSYTTTKGEDSDYSGRALSFNDMGNGTVMAGSTGLFWQKTPDMVNRAYPDAKIYCADLNLGVRGGANMT